MALSIRTVERALARRARRNIARFDHARRYLYRRDGLVAAGRTPFESIFAQPSLSVRYYPPLEQSAIALAGGSRVEVAASTRSTPLVLVAPLAVNMLIYDLFAERSLVRYLRARGFELYLIDWGQPGRAEDGHDLAYYFADLLPAALEQVRAHSGRRALSLHGWSFGGLFALCHAALADDADIANLVLVGAPADYHDNGALGARYRALSRQLSWLRERTGFDAHSLPPGLLRSPGWANSLAFKLTSPAASLKSYGSLLRYLHDAQYLRSHATNAAFLDRMAAYPGGVMQDIIDYLWVDNTLGHGRLPMRDAPVGLDAVRAPIFNITGRGDVIVTPECSQAMLGHVASSDITCRIADGGHVSIMGGTAAQQQTWPLIADWLIERDAAPDSIDHNRANYYKVNDKPIAPAPQTAEAG